MFQSRFGWACVGVLLACFTTSLDAQGSGSRGGFSYAEPGDSEMPRLDPEVAEGFITIDGRTELRIRPTELRVVLAVTSERDTALLCSQEIEATIAKIKDQWVELGTESDAIVADFIAVLPKYAWNVETRGDQEIGIEEKTGYRMQTNLHVTAKTEAEAMKLVQAAFENGVTDIIAFDYWCDDLDAIKEKARAQAVVAARKKADTLLTALFDTPPSVINLQEQTRVVYPKSLYVSFENSQSEGLNASFRRNLPQIRAYRPQNTYYHGMFSDGDVQPKALPMRPEISVISTVRLYYRSPSSDSAEKTAD